MKALVRLQSPPEGENGAVLVFPDEITSHFNLQEGQLVELSLQRRTLGNEFVENVIIIRAIRH